MSMTRRQPKRLVAIFVCLAFSYESLCFCLEAMAFAEDSSEDPQVQVLHPPPGLQQLGKHRLWVDLKKRHVVVDGSVCLREGQLEMFACPKGTKEHEAVVAIDCPAQFLHAALLSVGAQSGNTVSYEPEYKPASGTIIDVYLLWKSADGKKHQTRAQNWVRYLKTGKAMPYEWVFAGSGFYTDESTGKRHYMADAGDMICVSNFNTAMLDLPIQSSAAAAGLLFTAYKKRIPPLRTPVRLVLIPRPSEKKTESPPTPTASTKETP